MEKRLKLLDLICQVMITAACLIRALLLGDRNELIWLYFMLGGWQVLSFLIHFIPNAGWKNHLERRRFGSTLGGLVIAFAAMYLLLLLELPLIIFFLWGMLLIGPVMAIWYFRIGLLEWKSIRHHELIHLK